MAHEHVSVRQSAVRVVERMREAGFQAIFAGGCVRDELLSREPEDYDVVTDATPDQIASLFVGRASLVGAHFGVVIVREWGNAIEVATFRTDGTYSDRRRPDSVVFSTPEHDARRRDFTVNALFLDPLTQPNVHGASGRIIDFVDGLADLHDRIIRAVGNPDQRLAEDHLRALRAARFAAKLGFDIEPSTADAIRRHAVSLAGVSRERIGEELRRMMEHPTRAAAADRMRSLNLEIPALMLESAPFPPTLADGSLLAGLSPKATADQALAAYAMDRGAPATAAAGTQLATLWRTALCLSNEEQGAIRHIFSHVAELESTFLDQPVAPQKRLCAKWKFDAALELATLRRHPSIQEVIRRVEELRRQPGNVNPAPWLTGDDLIRLGLAPGPNFKRVLDRVYDAQLDGTTSSVEEAEAFARTLIAG
ncbi:MAG: CCA tRNA nucleotidyltransferase [Planctomycetota bacterium]|nr:CCA tRNA nucleotidyltransferase [Planctomycetota bacterium]